MVREPLGIKLWRWTANAFWCFVLFYFFVAHYCRFKMALGLATAACGCN